MKENGIPTEMLRAKKRILLVDDDQELLQVLTDFLEEEGRFQLRTASTGFDAGLVTREFQPDLILLDIMLPDINGREVCQRIKSDESTKWIKVIAISGMIEKEKIDELFSAGVDAYIQKPFKLQELLSRVGEMLEMQAT
jgi:DNA-binding response OmpR family regulator